MSPSNSAEVTLGEHTIPVYAQRHAYLLNRMSRFIDTVLERVGDLDATTFATVLQGSSYELLAVLLPNLEKRIPEYEFRGYGSREQMDAGDYDEKLDKSPTVPEIRHAFEVAARVNAFDVLRHLKGVVDPSLLRGVVNAQVAEAILQTSPSSPSENGDSGSTSSGTTLPTSPPSAD